MSQRTYLPCVALLRFMYKTFSLGIWTQRFSGLGANLGLGAGRPASKERTEQEEKGKWCLLFVLFLVRPVEAAGEDEHRIFGFSPSRRIYLHSRGRNDIFFLSTESFKDPESGT